MRRRAVRRRLVIMTGSHTIHAIHYTTSSLHGHVFSLIAKHQDARCGEIIAEFHLAQNNNNKTSFDRRPTKYWRRPRVASSPFCPSSSPSSTWLRLWRFVNYRVSLSSVLRRVAQTSYAGSAPIYDVVNKLLLRRLVKNLGFQKVFSDKT